MASEAAAAGETAGTQSPFRRRAQHLVNRQFYLSLHARDTPVLNTPGALLNRHSKSEQ